MLPTTRPYRPDLYQPNGYGRFRQYPRRVETPIPGAGYDVQQMAWAEQELDLDGSTPPGGYGYQGSYDVVPLRGVGEVQPVFNLQTQQEQPEKEYTPVTQITQQVAPMQQEATTQAKTDLQAQLPPSEDEVYLPPPAADDGGVSEQPSEEDERTIPYEPRTPTTVTPRRVPSDAESSKGGVPWYWWAAGGLGVAALLGGAYMLSRR